MYLEFEDHRPDPPRLPPSLTRLERVLLVAVAYLLIVVAYLVTPASVWENVRAQPPLSASIPRFVQLEPLIDRSALPKKPADASDLDRRSTTIERAPKPENEEAKSRGNTPEKVQSAPDEAAKGPESPSPPAPGATPPPEPGSSSHISSETPVIDARPPAGVLGNALRNLKQYLKNQNLDNPQGGQTEQGADIQFDSKGVDFGSWLRRFRAQVYSNWLPYIPTAADYQQGDVVIQLDIHRDGTITNLRIVRSSGFRPLDNAAFNSLKLSNPTVPLPAGFPDEVAPFTVTFRYMIR